MVNSIIIAAAVPATPRPSRVSVQPLTGRKLDAQIASMYRVDPASGEILCETAADALALSVLVKQRNGAHPPAQTVAPPRPLTNGSTESGELRAAKQALAFVQAVEDAEFGIGGEELVGKIGIVSVKAMGSVVQRTTSFLAESKYKLEDVVVRSRLGDAKVWKPGRSIEAAITALRKNVERLTPEDDFSDL